MADGLRTAGQTRAPAMEKARARLSALFDNGEYTELDRLAFCGDRANGAVCASGLCGGVPVYAYAQDPGTSGGAMGGIEGEKIRRLYDLAGKTGTPVVALLDSAGAYLDEGADALNAYGKIIVAASALSGVVPQVAVVAGDCAGSQAILAALADFVILVKGAEFGLSSAYLTGSAKENAAGNGTVSLTAEDDEAAAELAARLLAYLPCNNLSVPPVADYAPSAGTGSDVRALADEGSFLELSAGYAACAVTGFARIGGNPVGLVATNRAAKGGALCRNGARKIARFVRVCDAFSLPVVTLVDCDRFLADPAEERAGGVRDFAALAGSYAEATTVKITVVTGAAYGAVYTVFAGAAAGCDAVFALENAAIAALPPETAVQFLQKDRLTGDNRGALEAEYRRTVASPFAAAKKGLVSDVIPGAELCARVIGSLEMLASKRVLTAGKKHANLPL